MNKNERIHTQIRTIHLSEELDEKLKRYASKKHLGLSETIRRFIEKGLSIESYTEEQTMIRQYLREEIEAVLTKQIDRIIRLQLKATKASATGMYTAIAALADYFADDATYENVVAQALNQAALYMRQKEEPFEVYLNEAKTMIHNAEKIGKVDDN